MTPRLQQYLLPEFQGHVLRPYQHVVGISFQNGLLQKLRKQLWKVKTETNKKTRPTQMQPL